MLVAADRADVVRRESTGRPPRIGLRERAVGKHALDREMTSVEVDGHAVAVKVARLDGEVVNVQPEFEDVAAAARALGRPVKARDGRRPSPPPDAAPRLRLMDLAVIAIVFGGDLRRRAARQDLHRRAGALHPLPAAGVWIGVGLAFLVQTLIAVTVGHAGRRSCPTPLVKAVALVIFLVGAVLLFREAPKADAGGGGDRGGVRRQGHRLARPASPPSRASFLVLFAAEWGDLSQLLTISLVGRYDHPV